MLKFRLMAVLVAAVAGCGEGYEVEGADEDIETVSSAITFNGHDYLFFKQNAGGDGARFVGCPGPIYRLASINNAAENDFIRAEAVRHGGGNWWIGYTDRVTENLFKWDNGDPVGYVNWNLPTEPNDYNQSEDCVWMNSSTGKWFDASCNNANGSPLANFVCESGTSFPQGTFAFEYDTNDTASATRNVYQYDVNLTRNTKITFGTCGIEGANIDGDTFLRFKSPTGTELAFNDDACGSLGSNISYLVPATGTYHIHAGCYDTKHCYGAVGIQTLLP
jgi:hypothetical protein